MSRPAPLAALGLLAVNDHLLKGSAIAPAWLTGKLSDVAGLFFFPVLAVAVMRLVSGRRGSRGWIAASCAVTGLVFALIKLSPTANDAAALVWGENALDAQDLWALLALVASAAWQMRRLQGAPHGSPTPTRGATPVQKVLVAVAALACMATPAPRFPRNYPSWRVIRHADAPIGCADLHFWVSKSGKTGLGLSVRVRPKSPGCTVRIDAAELRVGASAESESWALVQPAAPLGDDARVTANGEAFLYIAFEFDNESLWNRGQRAGEIQLVVTSGVAGALAHSSWTLPVEHRLDGPHIDARQTGPGEPEPSMEVAE